MRRLLQRLAATATLAIAVLGISIQRANAYSFEGQNKGNTNWVSGPLQGWIELEFIPCRVVLSGGNSNVAVQLNFDSEHNGTPGIENLFYFTPSANVVMTTPVLTASNTLSTWTYNFTASVTDNQTGYIYYYARLASGAHNFPGSALHMFTPTLSIQKPGATVGSPDVAITKTGPSTVSAGQTITYTISFTNKLSSGFLAAGVQISDTLPVGTSYVPGSATGSTLVSNALVLGNQIFWDVANLNPGDSGTFTYQLLVTNNLTDGTILQNNAQIQIAENDPIPGDNVSVVQTTVRNGPPVANADTYFANRNQSLTVSAPGVLANDTDPHNSTLSAMLVSNVTSGTLTFNANGSFSYTPATNFAGVATFYYTATNAAFGTVSQPAQVSINVLNFAAPANTNVSCVASVPAAATNLAQFLAQGGVDGGPYCGQPTAVAFVGDSSNGGAGCAASPLVITRTYQLTIGCGNVTNVVQKITVSDASAPVISNFPANATYSCAGQVPPANDSLVTATDNCSGTVTISHNADVVTSSNCPNRMTISRTYVASDSCGNSTSRTQTITVNGTTAPVIAGFPADATLSCASSVPAADNSSVTATNACGGNSGIVITHSADVVTSSNCANKMTITRTYTATDACDNSSSKTQTFTINGTSAPTISDFPADATYSCPSAVPAANNSLVVAADTCGGSVVVTHDADVISARSCVNQYTISRTYHVTDACGNATTRTQTITVSSTTAPTIVNFPADATYTCGSQIPAASDSSVSAVDQCGGTNTLTITHDADVIGSSNCLSHFTVTRTYHVTDACGNSTSKTQTLTVAGTIAPTITTFPADATYGCANAVPAANDSLVAAVDGCGGAGGITISHNSDVITSSNCVNRFTITRTYFATDACGNSSSKSQTIVVNGTTAPTITAFPADATYSCANVVPSADDSSVTALDNCGSSSVTVSHEADVVSAQSCPNRFTITRTYHVTDGCGNVATRSQTITVNATNAPAITAFPADATFSCASSIPAADNSSVTAVDSCGGTVVVTHSTDVVTSSNCANHLTITRTYTATDSCGNSSSQTQTFTINGNAAPTITTFPADLTVSCPSAVPAPDNSAVVAADLCGATSSVVVTHDADVVSSRACVNQYTITRTYHVTDSCGNATTRNQTITVSSTVAPTIVNFPADATFSCGSEVPAANDAVVSVVDQCGGTNTVTITHDADVVGASNCLSHFTVSRTYRATDACGNITTKTQTFTIAGSSLPTITAFPADATFGCATAVPAADDTLVTAKDGCGGSGGLVVTHGADVITSSNCVNRFTITRTYTVSDACGNSTSKSQVITVNATTAPTITSFPADASYSCASAVPAADNSLVAAKDGCGSGSGVVVTHNADVITSSNCVNRFVISRTYIATDACGNSSSQTQTITVNQTAAPTITVFPADATFTCVSAVPTANDSLVTAVDGCGGSAVITHGADAVVSSNCANHMTISRTYTATDACGNSSSQTQTFTINGTTPPAITSFPQDVTVSCPSSVPAPNDSLIAAADTCGATTTVTVTHDADVIASRTCNNQYVINRTYRVTDACGFATTQTQRITVSSTAAPTIVNFPADATYTCGSQIPTASDSSVTAVDQCGGTNTMTVTHDADIISTSNCLSHFTVTRVYRVTDVCGNATSKAQVITVSGSTPPTIVNFPADATYGCAGSVPSADNTLVTAVDGCGGAGGLVITHNSDVVTSSNCVNRFTITRTYVATDACGNSTSKAQTITVNGTTPPTITGFPADATYSCVSAVLAADNTVVSATNACGGSAGVVITHLPDSISSSNCANRLTITRTYIATDACGNSSSKTQTITVNSTTAPTITSFPADATYSCSISVPSANDTLVRAVDGCGGSAGMVVTHLSDTITSSNCPNRMAMKRTYVVTDACGNSSSRTQTITVDNTGLVPTIQTFPVDATYQCAGSVPAANDSLVSALDWCGNAFATISHDGDVISSSNCPNNFVITRTYRATDTCGNSISRNQKITVRDTTAPSIHPLFTTNLIVSCASLVPPPDDTFVTGTDNCGGSVAVTHDADVLVSSNCVNRFTLHRTYHIADSCGNTTNWTETIIVSNVVAPTITAFPADATYSCVSAVPAANDALVSITDACGGTGGAVVTHLSDSITSINCPNRMTIKRTYIATDACGNSSSKTQTITVNSSTAPTITGFPADATYSCAGSVPAANNSLVSATDGCGGSGVVVSHNADLITSSNCVNRFTITRTYVATDSCGNSASKSQTITVNGTTPPTITGFPADVSYDCANAVPAANNSLVTATNACGGASGIIVTHNGDLITSSNCVNRFTLARTYVVTDACGNSSSKTQTIVVNATTAPTITSFPADASYSCASAVPAANDSLIIAQNACGGYSGVLVSHLPDSISASNCVNRFTITRTYVVSDTCGNSTSRSQLITVNSTTPPIVTTFPADATYSCASAVPAADDTLVAASAGCSGAAMTISHRADVITSSNCVNRFTISRTYVATDACGNASSKTQTITVNATTAPTITTFPADATYSCASAVPAANNSLVAATDGCGASSGLVISHNADVITSSNCVSRFVITRTYIATDACGNSSSKSQTITVNNTTAPTITTFPADTTFACAGSVPAADDTLVSAQDNCGVGAVVISHDADVITGSNCVNRFNITRTYRATDACGNVATKSQKIVVNDDVPPSISCPADQTIARYVDVPAPDTSLVIARDNCGIPTVSWVSDSYVTNGVMWTVTRTYAATDDCGNQTTGTQTISVNPLLSKPSANPDSYTVFENQTLTISSPGVLINDVDANNLPLQALLVNQPTNGAVTLNTNGGFQYTPAQDYNGPDTFVYQPSNGGAPGAPLTVSINVIPVNQPPSFTKGADINAIEDSGANSIPHWASNIKAGPPNESSQSVNFIVSTDNPNIFSVQPAISANGALTFTLKPLALGSANVTVLLHDDGGTANGGVDTSAPQSFVINIVPVNHAPLFTKGSSYVVNNNSGAQTVANWATSISPGPANESSQTLNFLVSNDNNSIFSTQPSISADGTLTFAPAAGHYGTANVSVALHDNGGTANGGKDTSATQMFVILVNNPPIASIVSPANGNTFLYPSPVPLSANAYDLDGTVTNLTFFSGGVAIGQGTPADGNMFTLEWTNAPASNCVITAVATDNYGASTTTAPVTINLGNPITAISTSMTFSPSLNAWMQKIAVTNPTVSTVQSITLTITNLKPTGAIVLGATGTNELGQPYFVFNSTVPPVSTVSNYATIYYQSITAPTVGFTVTASLSAGPGFTVNANNMVAATRHQFQADGSFLLNFASTANKLYYVQYTSDLVNWFTSPIPIRGTGSQMQWIDAGPSATESAPKSVAYRYYRIVAP